MTLWKVPPKAKVLEAMSAWADGRVTIVGPLEASVLSSSGNKSYTVTWSEDKTRFSSNDNASYWQGALGYPIIAVLLQLGTVDCDREIARRLAGVHWKQINDQFKRDYDRAVESVLSALEAEGVDRAPIEQQVEAVYEEITGLQIERGPRSAPPPKSS
jgi:hypothetical protein